MYEPQSAENECESGSESSGGLLPQTTNSICINGIVMVGLLWFALTDAQLRATGRGSLIDINEGFPRMRASVRH